MNILKKAFTKYVSGLAIIFILIIQACTPDPNADIADMEFELEVVRTDQLLYECAKAIHDNPQINPYEAYETYLKSEREFLAVWVDDRIIQANVSDEIKDTMIVRMLLPVLADSGVYQLLDTIQQIFPGDFPLSERITPTFKRFKKYFPNVEIPSVRTHVDGYVSFGDISTVDQVLYTPGYFSFGLHYFIGGDYPYYPRNVPQFIRERFSPEYLNVSLAHQLASVHIKPIPVSYETKLVDHVIHTGIKQYIVDKLLPNTPDSLKLFYTTEQMNWVIYYEAKIYNEILQEIHNMDIMAFKRYLDDKPHSTHLSRDSAPRLGQFAGWKIVSAYMERNPDITVEELSQMTEYEKIFRGAKYKP